MFTLLVKSVRREVPYTKDATQGCSCQHGLPVGKSYEVPLHESTVNKWKRELSMLESYHRLFNQRKQSFLTLKVWWVQWHFSTNTELNYLQQVATKSRLISSLPSGDSTPSHYMWTPTQFLKVCINNFPVAIKLSLLVKGTVRVKCLALEQTRRFLPELQS